MGQFAIPLILAAVSIAANVGLALLQPDSKIDGSRLNDLKAPKSNYGVQIPKVYGRGRLTGNLIWADKIKEVAKKKKSGKGFGPSTTQKTYTYYGNFSVLLSERIVGIRKIRLNSKLVYNSTGDSETVDNSNNWADKYIRIHLGDPDQALDPLEQAVLGNKAIAYRYRSRIVFEMIPLEELGNRFPQVSVEVQGTEDNPLLSDIVTDICLKTGLTTDEIDVTELADQTVSGFTIFQTDTARQTLGTLQQAYFFDCVESGNKLRFQKQIRPTIAATISKSDLASYEAGSLRPQNFKELRTQGLELPSEVNITFFDIYANHGEAVERSNRVRTNKINQENVSLPLALNSDEAKKIADRLLYLSWLRRRKFSFTLSPRFSYLEPGDVLATPFHDQIEKVQISKINFGANRLLEVEAFLYDAAVIDTTQTITLDDPPDDPVIVAGLTDLKILDIPLIVDGHADNGLYAISSQPASLFVSRNGGTSYDYATDIDLPSTYGICNDTLLNWSNDSLLDISNTIGITLSQGELESVSLTDLNNGQNTALIGNEIIRFQTATLTGTKTYTLSNLLRGRRGTEAFISTHTAGEPFTLLSDYIERINGEVTDIGKTLYFKAIAGDQSLDEITAVTHTVIGNSLKPYSPINPTATKDAAGNITVSWVRRDRHAGDRTDYANFPQSEVSEKYDIEILNGSSVVRALSSATPNVIYAASQQLTDFGSLQPSITFRVYQISAVFGRGTGRSATITLSLIPSLPKITGFSPTQGSIGQTITVYGSGFVGATALAINGTNCTEVTIASNTQISGIVATGTTTGFVTVTTPGGTATSATAFVIVAASGGSSGREQLTSDRTYYVSNSGNDSNNGLTLAAAFATGQKTIDAIEKIDCNGYKPTVRFANGTYTGFTLKSIYGADRACIVGESSSVIIQQTSGGGDGRGVIEAASIRGIWELDTFTLRVTGGTWANLRAEIASIDFKNLTFGANSSSGQAQIQSAEGGFIKAISNYSISGASAFHWWANIGMIRVQSRTISISGTPNFSVFAKSDFTGMLVANGNSYSGSATGKQYESDWNAVIIAIGATLPGNVSGTFSEGGKYL